MDVISRRMALEALEEAHEEYVAMDHEGYIGMACAISIIEKLPGVGGTGNEEV